MRTVRIASSENNASQAPPNGNDLMKHGPLPTLASLLACICFLFGCGSSENGTGAYRIAVVPKGTMHEFWKSVHAGALQAGRDEGVEIIWKGSLREDDREEQLQIVETFIASGVDALVLAPLDDRSLVAAVAGAKRAGIPTVVIDSALEGDDHVSFVATDNYRGGVLAAELVGRLLDGAGKIVVLRYQEGSASNSNRENGFLDTIRSKFPGIVILSDNQYVGPTTETAFRGSENMLNREGDIDAVFAPNEPVAFGCLRALQSTGRAGSVILVGFDASKKLVEALETGEVHGLVVQDPFRIGYLGVAAAVASLRGDRVEKRIDTGVVVATRENMHDPAIEKLLYFDPSEYPGK